MGIDGHHLQSIVVDSLSMDAFPNLLWPAMSIDIYLAQSVVTGNGYR